MYTLVVAASFNFGISPPFLEYYVVRTGFMTSTEKADTEGNTELVLYQTPKKRAKPKGAKHELKWEILENESIKGESGWEFEREEYWTSMTCKKYVKMYHIGKCWPKQYHQVHTRSFSCNPATCHDDHFLHRAEEVWVALFGDRGKTKGYYTYTLLSMVYAEVILKRKVNWSTYPTTQQYPLRIGRNQKHIPDTYDPESNSTKSFLEQLRKKTRQMAVVDTPPTSRLVTEEGANGVDTVGVLKGPSCVDTVEDRKAVGEHSMEEANVVQELGGDTEDVVPQVESTIIAKNTTVPNHTTSVDPKSTSKDAGPSK